MLAKPSYIVPTISSSSLKKISPFHRTLSPLTKPSQGVAISTCNLDSRSLRDNLITAFYDYQSVFASQRSEVSEPIILSIVDGALPHDFPSGTYYLTGPGVFTDDHGSTVHPLDGHGYLRAFVIDGVTREVKFMAKYVKTEAQVEERDPKNGTWKFTHRGPFSVLKGGKKFGNTKVMKNVANTSVLKWGGKLLCLWEGGDPYEIESKSLDTVGTLKLTDDSKTDDGSNSDHLMNVIIRLLKPVLFGVFKMPSKRLLSHYKIDAKRNRLIMVSCNAEDMLLPCSNFTFYEYDSKFNLLQKQEFNISDQMMIHDWAFTDSHYILFANRTKLDYLGSIAAVCGLSPMISAIAVNPSKQTSPIYLLPRFRDDDHGRDWKVPIEASSQLWLLHVGNAFENRDEIGNLEIRIFGSSCSYQWFNFQKMFGYNWRSCKLDPSFMNVKECDMELLPRLIQVSIKLDHNGNCKKCCVEPLNKWTYPSDFPILNSSYSGSENKYIYAATCSGTQKRLPYFPFDTVAKLDVVNSSVHTWSVGPRRFIGEPIFVPKGKEEDDGYLLVVEYAVAIQRCYLVILDPRKIGGDGALVARLEVPRHLNFPLGFHGFWANEK